MAGRNLVKPQTGGLDPALEQKESDFCDQKHKVQKDYVKLTLEELRSCKGFESVSDSEGRDIIESLFRLAAIVSNF